MLTFHSDAIWDCEKTAARILRNVRERGESHLSTTPLLTVRRLARQALSMRYRHFNCR